MDHNGGGTRSCERCSIMLMIMMVLRWTRMETVVLLLIRLIKSAANEFRNFYEDEESERIIIGMEDVPVLENQKSGRTTWYILPRRQEANERLIKQVD